ncbi:restriction endonuclease subunit S [Vibrio sp. FNV 38]|nr:restriction endonuclease subunit S [Vibrio sp. FNV 38]
MWELKKLGDICENLDSQRVPITKAKRVYGEYPYYGASGIVDSVADYLFDEELLLVSEDGANLLARTYPIAFSVSGKCWVNNHAHVLRFKSQITQRFIELYLNSISLAPYVSGMAQPKLNQRSLNSILVPFPEIEVQTQIVAKLDAAFADIEKAKQNAEQNLENARELFESLCLNSIFSEYTKPNCTVLDAAKNEKGSMRTGPFGSQLLKKEIVDSGIAVLGIDNAVNNEFKWGAKRFITPEKFEELSRFEVKPKDVLITIMGTCGRCVIVPDDIPKAINTKHICCITLDQNKCLSEYLHIYFLHHPIAREYLLSRAKGAIMAGLNMGIIRELPLVLPSIEEQRKLIEQVASLKNEISRLKLVYTNKIKALDELKQSVLQQAFSGKL